MEIKDYRVSAGFGVRFVVPMLGPVPIALDFGFPIVKGPGDREQVFSFWVGFFH
jgi:outer membrane protein insertion porin family